MQLRDMRLADAGWVAALSAQLGYPAKATDIAERLKCLSERPDNGFFVATFEDIGLGWLHVYGVRLLETSGYAEIGGIVVDTKMRRRGIGSALIQQAEKWARVAGYGELRLRSGIQRHEAHSFYRGLGYVQSKVSCMFRKEL